jgi:hypothetical protein
MLHRALLSAVLLLFPVVAPGQGNDEDYTKKIREYTTDPMFLTELVDHLPASATAPSPQKIHGYIAGTPGKLTYAKDVHRYFRELAKASPRVKVWTMGQSEEGREMILVAISDQANLDKLDRLKEITARLGDPRKTNPQQARQLIAEGKAIYWLTGAMHSPETGSPEMLMELGYRLAVDDSPHIRAIRANTVVLMTPVLEVDGRERMVDIYRYRQDHPGRTPVPLIYWGKYVAHDNNRDAIGLALKLSQHVMREALAWHPTVLHDLHESVPFLYISTGTGPYNAWLDPILIDEWHQLAYHEIGELTKRGVPGVWTHGFYDGWAPNYMFYAANGHNAIGRFYETFGNLIADTRDRTVPGASERAWFRPNPPLPKVKWSLRNNVNLQQSGLLIGLRNLADHKDRFLENYYLKSQRSVAKATTEGPAAFVIPSDEPRRAAMADFLHVLMHQGIEVHRTSGVVRVKEEAPATRRAGKPGDGAPKEGEKAKPVEKEIEFGEGSYVIRMDQPYSRMADMLLDTQYYTVTDPRPYDDTGWTLGALHNVKTVRVKDTAILKAAMTPASAEDIVHGGVSGSGGVFLVPNRAESEVATLRFRLKATPMEAAEEPFEAGGRKFSAGSLVIRDQGLRSQLDKEARALGLEVVAVDSPPNVKRHQVGVPRIALVHDWISTQDEGWWRIVFDRCRVPYDYVSVHVVAKTPELRSRWDVVVLPPIRSSLPRFINGLQTADAIPWKPTANYPNLGGPDQTDDIRGGIGYEGLAHLHRFVKGGGLLLAAPSSSVLAVRAGMVGAVDVVEPRGLRAQGSVYRTTVADKGSPIVYGYGETLPVYFSQGPLFRAGIAAILGGDGDGPDDGARRGSGRGGAGDPDVPQGRAFVPAPEKPKPPETVADIPAERLEFTRHLLVPEEHLPRVVLKFAKKDDLLVSGMLDKGEELADKPAVIDCPVGSGHVVLFAINPMWRAETDGSHSLVFNAILNWDHLGTRLTPPKPGAVK